MWGHNPSADELLDARLAAGWLPRTTAMVGGAKILGHAATRFGLRDGEPVLASP